MPKAPDQKEQIPTFAPDTFHVPAIIMLDNDLQPLDTKLYAIIYWLERLKDGRCWASNASLGKWCNSSASGVANSLVRLRDKKYIACIYDEKQQRKEIKTLVYYTVNPYSNEEPPLTQMSNIDSKKEKKYTSEMLTDIEKIYVYWLKMMIVDPAIRVNGTDDERRAALLKARKHYRLTDLVKAKVATRIQSMGLKTVARAIKMISQSDFHRGDNDRNWSATLKWICESDDKIQEWANKGGAE